MLWFSVCTQEYSLSPNLNDNQSMFLQLLGVMVEAASIDLEVLVGDERPTGPVVSGAAHHLQETVLDVIDVTRGALGEGNKSSLTKLLACN